MANILLTGIATLDIINQVAHYPAENEEIRALHQTCRRGGNAANTADVLNQLGHNASLICTLANDNSGQFIRADLKFNNIMLFAETPPITGATPTSYISLNKANGSRTIVHHRDLDELSFDYFNTIDVNPFDWFHFEGRNIFQTKMMMKKARLYNKPISLEIEKTRTDGDVNSLLPLANVIMFSKPFALSSGFNCATDCLQFFSKQFSDKIFSCTWGDKGVWIINEGNIHHRPAYSTTKAIDTIGAGDTFNAALIDALISQHSIENAADMASKLAGLKCAQKGFKNLVPSE